MNAAIAAATKPGLPPAPWIERQSQLQSGSHGTHVTSIAAGKSGVCPKAKIAAVLIDVPTIHDDVERRRSTFSDTSSITQAVEYLLGIAQEEQLPISINISLGTNGGSHDGASGVSRWLDAFLATPGRAICVAAGNAGQDKPQREGDLGWIMGRIHTSGQIPARGLEVEIEWTVIGDGIEDVSENELEIWYTAQDRFIVSVKTPGDSDWIEVKPREFVENLRRPGGVIVSIYNELYHPTNGCNYIAAYLSPNLDPDNFHGIPKGIWRIRLKGDIASLMFMVEEDGRRLLLTGDAQQVFILAGLEPTGFLEPDGHLHLDVLKVQHHGSEHNMDKDFASKVSADHYIFCGNGEHENPDLGVLDIVFKSRKDDDDEFHFWFSTTSETQGEGTQRREYFRKVERRAAKLKTKSGGRLKVHFNEQVGIGLDI